MNASTDSVSGAPLVIAHRGASAAAPENTLAAFALAFEEGADGLEFDVRLARDGVPVAIHDATLDRTALRAGRIADLTSAELRKIDTGMWFNLKFPGAAREAFLQERIPTLTQVFELAGARARALYVEMKFDDGDEFAPLVKEVVRTIRKYGLEGSAVVESFALEAVAEVKRIAPEIRTAALFERSVSRRFPSARRIIERALACRTDELSLHRTLARPTLVEASRRAGLPVVVWTVDHRSWASRARSLGLRAIITNRPALMLTSLRAFEREG